MKDPNMPELFVGRSQQDEGEPDTFDGTLWALPTAQERLDEAGGGPECDVREVARGIRHEEDAQRLARCWNIHAEKAYVYADDELARLVGLLGRLGTKRSADACRLACEARRVLAESYEAVAEELADAATDDGPPPF